MGQQGKLRNIQWTIKWTIITQSDGKQKLTKTGQDADADGDMELFTDV